MFHGAGSLAKIQHGSQRAGDIILRPLYCFRKSIALGQIGSNGAGKGTAGSMGIGIINALALEPVAFPICIEIVVSVIDTVPALNKTAQP